MNDVFEVPAHDQSAPVRGRQSHVQGIRSPPEEF
jgi:hypothetical protein